MEEKDRELAVIESVADKGAFTKFLAYAKLSGPGWMQGAITLGGGSLAGALFLGVVSGYGLLWIQPLAMICGIIMLSAIAYVTLSTGKKPLGLINDNLHPLLGWSWLVATIMANIVWCMPQFSLATAAIQQNLLPEGAELSQWAIIPVLFIIGMVVNYLYQSEGKGVKMFDAVIKVMVGLIVLSFMAVVVTLMSSGALPWGEVFKGYLPNVGALFSPSPSFDALIESSSNSEWWTEKITNMQRDRIMAAFGSAVGINMTFLLPYTLLRKKWGKKHRGLSITDLSIGLFVPFFIATSCVVIAAASSFHAKTGDLADGAGAKMLLDLPAVVKVEEAKQPDFIQTLPEADHQLAAMLVKRDAGDLAVTLEPLAGKWVSQKIFGLGVLGMGVSTIIILMLINGLAFQELLGKKKKSDEEDDLVEDLAKRKTHYFIGCAVSGIAGCCFPLVWTGESKAALAVPTSVLGGSLLPIAYFTFFLLMNSKKVLGEHMPKGKTRIIFNALMLFSTFVASFGSVWGIKDKSVADIPAGKIGIAFLAIVFIVGIVSFLKHEKKGLPESE